MAPAKLQALLQAAIAHHKAGRLTEADALYKQARVAAPKHFDVLHLSGLVAYQQSRIAEAIDLLGRAHKLDRKAVICEMRYALALVAAQRTAEAEKHLRNVVALQPKFHEGWDNLAYCLKTQDRLDEAIECHRKAVAVKPDYANGWYNYGLTLSMLGRYADALACHDRALAVDPNFSTARFGRAQALQQADRIPEAIAEYETYLKAAPKNHEARSYQLLAMQYLENISREELFAKHVAFGRVVGGPRVAAFANVPDPARKLRIAVLSPDLREHSCTYFLEPLLRNLPRDAFEIYLYHDHFRTDFVSDRLKAMAKVWRNFVGQAHPLVAETIRADAPDILIDLAGHTGMTNRLPVFAQRVAPVQITYLGYPNSTGVPAMDYRFTDEIADPTGDADQFATERLMRFAPTAWCYAPAGEAPDVVARPSTTKGHVTFGCFNTFAKVTDATLKAWSRILAAVPDSRLLIKGRGLVQAEVQKRNGERFLAAGISPDRVDFLARTPDTKSHLAFYGGVDIALDTFPYHGTTTTCEALWMGVPVVTLTGDRHMTRVGTSLLTAIGRSEWVAGNVDEYVRIACELAANPARLIEASGRLRQQMLASPLMDHSGQAARFAMALRACWAEWCAKAVRAA